jgi:hypothetical protein
VFVHCYLHDGVVLENLFRSLGVVTTGGALTVMSLYIFRRGLFFPFFFFFGLCASLISRFALDVMLLQRLDVFSIILVLIYSLYRKKLEE